MVRPVGKVDCFLLDGCGDDLSQFPLNRLLVSVVDTGFVRAHHVVLERGREGA